MAKGSFIITVYSEALDKRVYITLNALHYLNHEKEAKDFTVNEFTDIITPQLYGEGDENLLVREVINDGIYISYHPRDYNIDNIERHFRN